MIDITANHKMLSGTKDDTESINTTGLLNANLNKWLIKLLQGMNDISHIAS